MYLAKSIIDGLKILGFDHETIKRTSKEKSLEEIFLSTLFLNYLIILVIYLIIMLNGGISISGKEVNTPILFGFLLIYPFMYNLFVYILYGFFGLMAELVNKKSHVHPLIATGFHTAIVYTIIIYLIALIATFNLYYAMFLLLAFGLYFIYTIFVSISTIYDYSLGQTLIVIMLPVLILSFVLLTLFLMGFSDLLINLIFG